jgi:hypothetical protein
MRHLLWIVVIASGSLLTACASEKTQSKAPEPRIGHIGLPPLYPSLPSVTQGQAWEKAIADRIKPCWNFNPSASSVNDSRVDVRLYLRPDGTVLRSELADPALVKRSPEGRAAVEAALRASVNPTCNTPLPRPITYKEIILVFDPKDMGQ